MNKTKQVIKYVIADIFAAVIAWALFFIYRKYSILINWDQAWANAFMDVKLKFGLFFIAIYWLCLYVMHGAYRKIYRKSRLKETAQTFFVTFLGIIPIFFVLILDDTVATYTAYSRYVFVLFTLHFCITSLLRFIITTQTAHKIHNKEIGFKTIIIGSDENAVSIFKEIEGLRPAPGNLFIGYVNGANGNSPLSKYLPNLGTYEQLKNVIQDYQIEEVIIAIERTEKEKIQNIITALEDFNVMIKAIPDIQYFLFGNIKLDSIFGPPLIEVHPDVMPVWQQSVKLLMDITVSILALILLLPVIVTIAIMVKLSSKGPILYSHERVGLKGKPFTIHKFRSMYMNSESEGPQLSNENDPRITPIGRFLRKVRLDEVPQFYNVLKGEMSLVGYRPERQYFIDKIMEQAPYYRLLLKIKPGITSWGQVKYGYAENVDQMIERLKYDILYIENMSLSVDIKILINTALIIVQGRGK